MQTKHATPNQRPDYIKDLLLLFSVPLGISVLAATMVYVPRFFAHPAYDFIYSYCVDYRCTDSYSLDPNGRIAKNTSDPDSIYYGQTQLRYFDAAANATRTISYAEAQTYTLLNSSKSPDGYTLTRDTANNSFLFWGNSNNSWRLESGWKKRPVTLESSPTYYSDQITFLGWVPKND